MRAIISLGTNTVRLLVVEDTSRVGSERIRQLEHRAVGTRLGEGLGKRGLLSEAAMRRTLDAVAFFMERIAAYEASLVCIATSAMRRAENAASFQAAMLALTGVPLRIIEGEEEAAASFRGVTYAFEGASEGRIAVLDIGGGSTECAVGRLGSLERSLSLEIGSVRVTERFPHLNGSASAEQAHEAAQQAKVAVREILHPLLDLRPVAEIRAVAGTPATIAAIVTARDVEHVRGVSLRREDVHTVLERLLGASLEERRAIPGMLAQRADVLAAGAIVLDAAMEMLGCERVQVETNDLLLGYLLSVSFWSLYRWQK